MKKNNAHLKNEEDETITQPITALQKYNTTLKNRIHGVGIPENNTDDATNYTVDKPLGD